MDRDRTDTDAMLGEPTTPGGSSRGGSVAGRAAAAAPDDPVGARTEEAELREAGAIVAVVVVTVGGLLVGGLTSVGQGILPLELASIANSAGSWTLAAFLLCLVNRVTSRGALLGAAALVAMVVGYALVTELRGFPVSTRLVVFWGLAAVTVGPAVGIGAAWSRGLEPTRRALAAGVLGGILIGEGFYGVTVIAGTTSPGYWVAQAILGLAIVIGSVALRLQTARDGLLCVAATTVVSTAFYLAYAANPITLLAG